MEIHGKTVKTRVLAERLQESSSYELPTWYNSDESIPMTPLKDGKGALNGLPGRWKGLPAYKACPKSTPILSVIQVPGPSGLSDLSHQMLVASPARCDLPISKESYLSVAQFRNLLTTRLLTALRADKFL